MGRFLFLTLFIAVVLPLHGIYCAEKASSRAQITREGCGEQITFTSPSGWQQVAEGTLPPNVHAMLVGKGGYLPPSINISSEEYSGTLEEYLEIVKAINASKGAAWKSLGSIATAAGMGNLSQVDVKTVNGDLRMIHLILLREKVIFIMTAAALKEEFAQYYSDFFNTMRTFKIDNVLGDGSASTF